jgi:hypothetical protein
MPRPFFKRWALRYALLHKWPGKWDVIEQGAPPRYFVPDLINKEGQRKFIVQDMDESGVSGLWFETERDKKPAKRKLTNRELEDYRISFQEQLPRYSLKYTGWFGLLWGQLTLAPARRRFMERLAQGWYNAWPIARRGRLEVLRFFLDRTIQKRDYKSSYVGLVADMFGNRYVAHPQEQETDTYYQLVLASLKASGDLEDNQGTYSLSSQAIKTLAAYEEEERRHRDNVRIQVALAVLTFVLMIIAAVQAYVSYWSEIHPG